jgi:hypothetical protein
MSRHRTDAHPALWMHAEGQKGIKPQAALASQYVLLLLAMHIWRAMQARYQEGVQTMLEQYFSGEAFEESNYIVREGELAPQYK